MTPERIAEIRERADAATPGPWSWVEREPSSGGWGHTGPDLVVTEREREHQEHCKKFPTRNHKCGKEHVLESIGYDADSIMVDEADADFIAASRTDVPDLLDALAALQQENARLRAALTEVTDTAWGEWTDAVDIARNALREKPRD